MSALDSELRRGKDPTLPTLADGIAYCLEIGLKALAEKNNSAEGQYIADVFSKQRRKELEEKVRVAEYEIQGFVPRDFTMNADVRPIRRVDEG